MTVIRRRLVPARYVDAIAEVPAEGACIGGGPEGGVNGACMKGNSGC